jgi:hypothetical protein
MMMSDSQTNRPMSEKERIDLLNKLIRERYGDWATLPNPRVDNNEDSKR